MEGVIDGLATSIASFATVLVTSGVAFVRFGVLWLTFAAAVVWSQGSLEDAWQWIGSLHIVVQLVVWLLFLPVMASLWYGKHHGRWSPVCCSSTGWPVGR